MGDHWWGISNIIGAWVGYKLQGKRVSDKEIFLNWYNAFFRRAFRGKFDWMTGGTNVDSFKGNMRKDIAKERTKLI